MESWPFLVFGILLVSFAGLMTLLVWYGDKKERKNINRPSPLCPSCI